MARPTPIDEEIELDPKRYIVSKTDATGIITYANDYFSEVAQYSNAELIGQPHNIVRHPDMPLVAFKLMWDTNETIGYTAYRRAPSRRAIERIIPIYKRLCDYEKIGGMETSGRFLKEFLEENHTTYDTFINELSESNFITELLYKIQQKLFKNK